VSPRCEHHRMLVLEFVASRLYSRSSAVREGQAPGWVASRFGPSSLAIHFSFLLKISRARVLENLLLGLSARCRLTRCGPIFAAADTARRVHGGTPHDALTTRWALTDKTSKNSRRTLIGFARLVFSRLPGHATCMLASVATQLNMISTHTASKYKVNTLDEHAPLQLPKTTSPKGQ